MRIFRPTLTAFVPDGWLVRETIQLALPEHDAYVVASTDLVPDGTTPEDYAGQFEQALAGGLPGYEQLTVETVELQGGRSALVRKSRWSPPEGEPVAELQMYVVANGRGIVSTARVPEKAFDELEPQLRELLAGIGVDGHGPAGGILRRDESARSRTYEAFEVGRLTTSPAKAFGLEATNGDEAEGPDQGATPWQDVRPSWQQVREEL